MSHFEEAYKITLKHEGGYSNHEKDKGGETYKGIARNFWPDWGGWIIIDEIKGKYPPGHWDANLQGDVTLNEFVESFYKFNFWDKLKCSCMPQPIANELFDTSVNMGIGYGAMCFQNALNKLNRNQKDYPDLKVDGGIGPVTIGVFSAYLSTERFKNRNREKLIEWLLKWMNYFQLKRYDEITERNAEQEIFIPGWTERT